MRIILVYVRVEEEELIIEKNPGDKPLAVHSLSKGKGQLIKNTHHSRDRSKGIQAYMESIKGPFENPEKIQQLLDEIYQRYPRYIRDQLQILQRGIKDFEPFIQRALDICVEKTLWSANDFHDVAKHLARIESHKNEKPELDIPVSAAVSEYYNEKASIRELDGYLKILGGAYNGVFS